MVTGSLIIGSILSVLFLPIPLGIAFYAAFTNWFGFKVFGAIWIFPFVLIIVAACAIDMFWVNWMIGLANQWVSVSSVNS